MSDANLRHPSEGWDLLPSGTALADRDPSLRWGDDLGEPS